MIPGSTVHLPRAGKVYLCSKVLPFSFHFCSPFFFFLCALLCILDSLQENPFYLWLSRLLHVGLFSLQLLLCSHFYLLLSADKERWYQWDRGTALSDCTQKKASKNNVVLFGPTMPFLSRSPCLSSYSIQIIDWQPRQSIFSESLTVNAATR